MPKAVTVILSNFSEFIYIYLIMIHDKLYDIHTYILFPTELETLRLDIVWIFLAFLVVFLGIFSVKLD